MVIETTKTGGQLEKRLQDEGFVRDLRRTMAILRGEKDMQPYGGGGKPHRTYTCRCCRPHRLSRGAETHAARREIEDQLESALEPAEERLIECDAQGHCGCHDEEPHPAYCVCPACCAQEVARLRRTYALQQEAQMERGSQGGNG
jgi:hypothetical protein